MEKGSKDKVKVSMKKKDKPKPKKKFVGKGLKIVDEDSYGLGYKPPSDSDDEEAEDLPQIAAVVDERPVEIQVLESFSQSKWKRLEEDQGKSLITESKHSNNSMDLSPPRRRNVTPPRYPEGRRKERERSVDASPPRRRNVTSPRFPDGRRKERERSEDISPPRRRNPTPPRHPDRRRKGRERSVDISPPRRRNVTPPRHPDGRRKERERSLDASPPRRRNVTPPRYADGRRKERELNVDTSPPRRRNVSPPRYHDGRRKERERNVARPEILEVADDDGKIKTTLDGKKAGLQKAAALRDEMLDFRRRENELFEQLPDEVSGRNAKAVVRDRRTEADIAKEQEKQKKEELRKEQYDKWGKGLKQVEEQEARVRSALHEMAKPLARYKDDEDLDDHLKKVDREGDPMLEYLTAKRRKTTGITEKPKYNGPPPPPNRFNIPPGYRWDGVDRSNGYEKEWFSRINAKKALQEEAYKWSVEDL